MTGELTGKRLPIGYDDFKSIIQENCYYIDKTPFLQDLQDNRGTVNLFLRPRRFGKSLMLSTIKYFYENTLNEELNAENRALFNGLKIAKAPEVYRVNMTAYPVISLTLKSAKVPTFEDAIMVLRTDIANELDRHIDMIKNIERNDLEVELKDILAYSGGDKPDANHDDFIKSIGVFRRSLLLLSKCLYETYNKKVIILIDEYDVPLENAYFRGFYDAMIDFIRSLFESGLKTNPYLEFAVITGCLRVSKESLFTGMNNLNVITMDNNHFSEYFGFTQKEVENALDDYKRPEMRDEIKRWYNGYRFGSEGIYNPWSIIKVLADLRSNEPFPISSFWANTSGNEIIHTLVDKADESIRVDLETLTEGKSIEKEIHEDVTYADMLDSDDNLFNFLYFTGYLTAESISFNGKDKIAKLIIPNIEVLTIYERKIIEWFNKRIALKDFGAFYKALEEGDVKVLKETITKELSETISYNNYDESYYHGFLAGLLKRNGKRGVKSDRESGLGRYDIAMIPPHWKDTVIIIEIKQAKNPKEVESKLKEAIEQIKTKDYASGFYNEGYANFMVYAMVFFRKSVEVSVVKRD